MPQPQETSRLAPGLSRAVVELPISESGLAVAASSPADRIALGALDAALVLAREAGEDRPGA